MNLDGYYALPVKKLKGTEPVESLDLSGKTVYGHDGKSLGVASAVVIASLIGVNGSLTRLDVRLDDLGEEGKAALRKAIEGRSGFKLLL